ncbi:HK97 gp10 family phage protein [Paraburkholderia aspalathi]|nr:HK97 gp10 family phage protein [Paraburkholderia aspalathi]
MSRNDNGLAKTLAAFDRLQTKPREAITRALIRSGNQLASTQRHLAETSRDTGALIDSIAVTQPGQTTPPYSQPGGSRVAADTEVIVTAGNTDVRYAHLVEYGTSKAEAQPFFWPALRLMRKRLLGGVALATRKAVKDSWK